MFRNCYGQATRGDPLPPLPTSFGEPTTRSVFLRLSLHLGDKPLHNLRIITLGRISETPSGVGPSMLWTRLAYSTNVG